MAEAFLVFVANFRWALYVIFYQQGHKRLTFSMLLVKAGGGRGIRTLDTV